MSVPQQYVLRNPQGYIPEQEWDDGVNMAFLNYSYSGRQREEMALQAWIIALT
ncbi:hypothetical protein DMH27_03095 [Raoultella planticola]|nr:hypothetical protein [Raoultella planticola]